MTISIMYITCTAYKNLWNPFLLLAKKYLDFEKIIYLCTDIPVDKDLRDELSSMGCKILVYGKKSDLSKTGNYYDRLQFYLDKIQSNTILCFHDDYFPNKKVSEEIINRYMTVIEGTENIKNIKMCLSSWDWPSRKRVTYNNCEFTCATVQDDYIFNVQPYIIKRLFFKDLIEYCKTRMGKDIHLNGGLEVYGTDYFKNNTSFQCLRVVNDVISIYGGSDGLVKAGMVKKDVADLINKVEGVQIQSKDKGCIFDITPDELNIFGSFNKDRLLHFIKS